MNNAVASRPRGAKTYRARRVQSDVSHLDNQALLKAEIAKLVIPATPRILMYKGSGGSAQQQGLGSGGIFEKDGKIYGLTAAHVAETDEMKIVLPGQEGAEISVKVLGIDPVADVSVFDIPQDLDVNPLALAAAVDGTGHTAKPLDFAFACGNPLGLGPNASIPNCATGEVMDNHEPGAIDPALTASMFAHNALIAPGNSGGSLVNSKGEIFAVNVAGFLGLGIFLSTPTTYVEKLLAASKGTKVRIGDFSIVNSPNGPLVYAGITSKFYNHSVVARAFNFRARNPDLKQMLKAARFKAQAGSPSVLKSIQGFFATPQLARMNEQTTLTAYQAESSVCRVIELDGEEVRSTADVAEILEGNSFADSKKFKGMSIVLESNAYGLNGQKAGVFEHTL